jgi:hypothetical protein
MVFFLTDIEFAADDRLDSSFFGGIDEMHRAKDVAVIGHSHGWHSELLRPFAEQLNVAGSVEHGVIGMQMKMDELSWRSGHRHPVKKELFSSILPSATAALPVDYLVQIQPDSGVARLSRPFDVPSWKWQFEK